MTIRANMLLSIYGAVLLVQRTYSQIVDAQYRGVKITPCSLSQGINAMIMVSPIDVLEVTGVRP
jgi:hypothetical protein